DKLAQSSPAAGQAFGTLLSIPVDHGAALIAAANAGNPFASAMVKLNDTNPDSAQMTANVTAMANVASAAASTTPPKRALGSPLAVRAIHTFSPYAPTEFITPG